MSHSDAVPNSAPVYTQFLAMKEAKYIYIFVKNIFDGYRI